MGGQKKSAPQPAFVLQAEGWPPAICPIIGAGLGGDRGCAPAVQFSCSVGGGGVTVP